MKPADCMIWNRRKNVENRHLSEHYYYVGEHKAETTIQLTQYNADSILTRDLNEEIVSFKSLADRNQVNWFQVNGLTDSETVTRIVNEFGMHNLDAKDILTPEHVAKIEEYDKHLLFIFNSTYYNSNLKLCSEHISILITENIVITFTESHNPIFERVCKAHESNMMNIRTMGVGYIRRAHL